MTLLLKLALGLVALWAALVLVFAALQTSLLFPRALVGSAPQLPAQAERLTLNRPDNVTLHGVRIPGRDAQAPVLLGFGGNAWNAQSMALFLHQVAPAHTVVVYHYRGYAPSTGTPSAQALIDDAVAIRDSLDAAVIAVGFSIGSGVVAHLAQARQLRGAVLVTPFDTLGAVARASLPWAPVRRFFRHEMDALGALRNAQVPLALIVATHDEVIAPARAERLIAGLAHSPIAVDHIVAGHNDIYNHPDFVPALRAQLQAMR